MVALYYMIFKAPEDENVRKKLFEILSNIAKRDNSFVWGTSRDKKYVTIVSESEKQSHLRGYWIKNKAALPAEYRRKLVYKIYRVESNSSGR